MNKERHKQINALIDELEDILSRIDVIREEENEYYDNMPDSMKDGDKGGAALDAVAALEVAQSAIEDAQTALDEALA